MWTIMKHNEIPCPDIEDLQFIKMDKQKTARLVLADECVRTAFKKLRERK
jgi:hypothetical protein